MRANTVVIVVRQSPNWLGLAQSGHDTASFDALIYEPPGTTAALIRFWNETMPVSFYAARAAMKEIAAENLAMVAGARIQSIDQFRPPFERDALYTFIDDDDWFAPDLAERLLSSEAAIADGTAWQWVRFTDGNILAREYYETCHTNNYAVHGSFLAERDDFSLACQHFTAQRLLYRDGVNIFPINAPLSITNKHPCSFLGLKSRKFDQRSLRTRVGSYRKFLTSTQEQQNIMARDVAWALPYMQKTSVFFSSLSIEKPREPSRIVRWLRRTIRPATAC